MVHFYKAVLQLVVTLWTISLSPKRMMKIQVQGGTIILRSAINQNTRACYTQLLHQFQQSTKGVLEVRGDLYHRQVDVGSIWTLHYFHSIH